MTAFDGMRDCDLLDASNAITGPRPHRRWRTLGRRVWAVAYWPLALIGYATAIACVLLGVVTVGLVFG